MRTKHKPATSGLFEHDERYVDATYRDETDYPGTQLHGGVSLNVARFQLAGDAAFFAHAANAYPKLVAFVCDVAAAIAENGTDVNLANMLDDAESLLREFGEQ